MSRDPFKTREGKRWVQDVLTGMVPKLEDSALVMHIVPGDREGDVKFWVELGASIMLNKPIVAIVTDNLPIPPKLELVADEIVRLPEGLDTPTAEPAVVEALERVIGRLEAL